MEQRVAERGEGIDPGDAISDGDPDETRRPVSVAGHVHDAGERLRDVIVASEMRQGTLAAKGRDRTHNEAGIELSERLVIQTSSFHDARAVVLDNHIDLRDECANQLDAFRLAEVYAEAFFAAVLLDEVHTATVFEKRQSARRVPTLGLFDLDNLCSEFSHQPGRRRASQILSKV